MKRKILSLVLTVLMVIGLMPGITLKADAASATVYLITKGPTATGNYHIYKTGTTATDFDAFSGSNADRDYATDHYTTYSTIEKAMTDIRAAVGSSSATLYFAATGINLSNVIDEGATGTLDIGEHTVELGASGTYTINGKLTGSSEYTVSVEGASLIVSGNLTSIVNTGTDGCTIDSSNSSVSVSDGLIQADGASSDTIRNDGTGTVNISGGKIYSKQGSAIDVLTAGTVTISGAEWNETDKTGTLVRSDASAGLAIGFDAVKGMGGTLTVNGGTVSGKGRAIGGRLSTITINNGTITAENGGALLIIAGTLTVNGGDISSGNPNTGIAKYPGVIFISDLDMGDANLYLNGGSVENTAPGCPAVYCYRKGSSCTSKVYLSGSPSVSGTADIWTNTPIYADDGAASPVNYTGSPLSVEYGGTITAGDTVAVSHVSSGVNDTLFAVSNPGYSLNKSGTDLVIGSPATSVILAIGSFGTAGDGKITGLTSGTIYKVNADTVYYVKADGTLSTNASDAAPLTGTEITGLTNGTTYMVEVYTPGGGGSSGHHKPKTDTSDSASVVVDGKTQTAGTVKTTEEDGKKTTTVTLSNDDIETVMKDAGNNATFRIPVTSGCDKAIGRLDGQAVKYMEKKDAVIEIDTGSASYTLPASEIDIDAVSAEFGNSVALNDITVDVAISGVSDKTAKIAENAAAAGGYSIAVPAVEFTVNCTYGGKTVNVSSFNSYVERMIAIPDGVDASKITTAVVVEADGSVHHVPTEVTMINGKYYAKINSLTNSVYALIWHPLEFSDVETHWAKDEINDMGSRLVVSGVGNNMYEPKRSITRAEFAAIMVKALGLEPGTGTNGFRDVNNSAWYCPYIETATSYGIIKGYDKDTFGPSDTITREQAMTMIARAIDLTGIEANLTDSEISSLLAGYADGTSTSNYAKDGIAACIKTGIVSGTSENMISPKKYVTRAEVAVMAERLLQKSGLI